MKAMVLHGNYDVRYEDVQKPAPGYDQVLVKVKYVGLCATDISFYTGNSSFAAQGLIRYPMIQGHEWSGVVEEIGDGVKKVQVGDRVIGDCAVTCGYCQPCLAGDYIQCENQRAVGTVNAWDGAMADYILMPQRSVYKIPDNVDMDVAALVEPLAIGFYAVQRAQIKLGDAVVICGTGAIGFGALCAAVHSAARTVILAGRKSGKLALGKRLGADACVNLTKEDFAASVKALTGGKGADVIVEATGAQETLLSAVAATRDSGTIAIPAFYEQSIRAFPMDDAVLRNLRIVGVSGSPNMAPHVLEFLSQGEMQVRDLITARYKVRDLEKAYEDAIHNRENIKIMLEND